MMGPPAVSLVFVLALGLTLVEAEGTSVPAEDTNPTRADSQRSPLQRRQDLLYQRLNGLNEADARLNSRLNGVDGRFDYLETKISDMKEYLRQRLDAMEVKVEWALAGTKHRGEVGNQPTKTSQIPKDCQEAYEMGMTSSGIYRIAPEPNTYMDVLCEQELDGGGWIVFQLRKDGSVNFYQNWETYREGFGQLTGEFWFGNNKIHLLTKRGDQELKIELVSPDSVIRYANYQHFSIGDETEKFRLNVTGYSGGTPPGDSMRSHNGMKFSTKDEDNDTNSPGSCAQGREGAWWYPNCGHSSLNGKYGDTRAWKGIFWVHWKRDKVSMKGTRMLLRKRS